MKNSGIEWIGEIPDSWEYFRLKDYYMFEKGKNAAIYTQDYIGLHKGIYPVYSGQTENNGVMGCIDTFDYDLEECLFTTTVGAKVMTPKIIRGKFSLSQNCLIMKKTKSCNNSYVYYYLLPLFDYAKSLIPTYMQPSLRVSDLNQYGFFVPEHKKQQKIANYLDEKCEKIDELIANQQGQIEKLKEYKQSVITEAVTKGLDKSAPLKDSGILHIGQIPLHWKIKKHKYVFKKEKNLCEKYAGEDILSLTMNGVIVRDLDNPTGKMPTTFDGYQYVEEGNLLLCLFDIDVTPRCVGVIKNNGLTSPAYSQYKIISGDNVNYFYYLLLALDFKKDLLYLSKNLRSSLSDENFGLIETIIPPSKEQQQIVDYLDKKCGKIDRLIAIKQEKIEKLQEYKKSLIYEYVTGKKEVI